MMLNLVRRVVTTKRFDLRGNLPCRVVLMLMGAVLSVTRLHAAVPFEITGPGVDPADFRITEFAGGLNYPVGMVELSDGSVLVATTNGTPFFGSRSGSIIRLVDTDDDGVADVTTTLVDDVPAGKLSALRAAGDLLFVTGQGSGAPISIYRMGEQPADTPTPVGSLEIQYQGSWLHPHSALAVRPTPGVDGSYDLFFQLGSRVNFAETTATLTMSSTIGPSAQLAGDALHMIRITDDGTSLQSSAPQQIATGLRNPAGMAFHPLTGDLYLQDNGIDGVVDANEPTSADELNVITAAQLGSELVDFGFPNNYTEYRTNQVIGGEGVQPLVAFQPIPMPDGAEAEGPNDIAFAPAAFPDGLNNGVFVGMHGRFSLGGLGNEENPLVFVNLHDNSYFHFISNEEAGVGHLDGLLSTADSLFVADISPDGSFNAITANSGKIYQIRSLVGGPSLPSDFNSDGILDVNDLNLLLTEIRLGTGDLKFDRTGDGTVDLEDVVAVVTGPDDFHTYVGDANLDLEFNSGDLVMLFQAGEYEDNVALNSTWETGDWNGDGEFGTGDLLFAFQNGGFEEGPRMDVAVAVPEPHALAIFWVGTLLSVRRRR